MKKNKVLIVVAHTDDETIAMGGTIKKHAEHGDEVYAISMTNGVSSRDSFKIDEIAKREVAAKNASVELGFIWEKNFDFSDNALDKYPIIDIIKSIEKIKNKIKPNLVYTHSAADLNIDHRIVSQSVLTAFRPIPEEICKEIRLFEVASSTEYGHKNITDQFVPNLFISISDTWDAKKRALSAYFSEIRDYPHPRSLKGIKNLNFLRGTQVGISIAEAFQVIRKIEI